MHTHPEISPVTRYQERVSDAKDDNLIVHEAVSEYHLASVFVTASGPERRIGLIILPIRSLNV